MFRELFTVVGQVRVLIDAAYRDWNEENMEGCLTRLEEAATDCEQLSAQIRQAIADYEAAKGE